MPIDPRVYSDVYTQQMKLPGEMAYQAQATRASQQEQQRAQEMQPYNIRSKQAESSLDELKAKKAKLDMVFQLARSAPDTGSWAGIKQQGTAMGLDMSQVPDMADPAFKQNALMALASADAQLNAEMAKNVPMSVSSKGPNGENLTNYYGYNSRTNQATPIQGLPVGGIMTPMTGAGSKMPSSGIQLFNKLQELKAAHDTQGIQELYALAKTYEKYQTTDESGKLIMHPGAADTMFAAAASTEGGKQQEELKNTGPKERAKLEQDLALQPDIEARTTNARNTADFLSKQSISDKQAIPLLDQLEKFNNDTFDMPYPNLAQVPAKLAGAYVKQTTAFDLMNQNRSNMAIPLAKALGVNPTDRDFSATLDAIFDMSATKISRQAQIQNLRIKIENRQGGNVGILEEPAAFKKVKPPELGKNISGYSNKSDNEILDMIKNGGQ